MADTKLEFKQHTQGVPRIRAVERTIKLLSLFSAQSPHLSLGELARGMGTNKGTAHRYAVSLVDAGILLYDSTSNTYSISIHILSIAAAAVIDLSVVKIAKEQITKLAHEIGETVVLAMWDETSDGPVIADFEYSSAIGIRVAIGYKLGKDSAHWKLFEAFRRSGDAGVGSGIEDDPEISDIRKNKLAVAAPGGFWVMAAPVFNGDRMLASLAIVGMGDLIPEQKRSAYGDKLKGITEELSEEITMILRVSKTN